MGAGGIEGQRWLTMALWLVATILLALIASIEPPGAFWHEAAPRIRR